jgi:hypothetical protein
MERVREKRKKGKKDKCPFGRSLIKKIPFQTLGKKKGYSEMQLREKFFLKAIPFHG